MSVKKDMIWSKVTPKQKGNYVKEGRKELIPLSTYISMKSRPCECENWRLLEMFILGAEEGPAGELDTHNDPQRKGVTSDVWGRRRCPRVNSKGQAGYVLCRPKGVSQMVL